MICWMKSRLSKKRYLAVGSLRQKKTVKGFMSVTAHTFMETYFFNIGMLNNCSLCVFGKKLACLDAFVGEAMSAALHKKVKIPSTFLAFAGDGNVQQLLESIRSC